MIKKPVKKNITVSNTTTEEENVMIKKPIKKPVKPITKKVEEPEEILEDEILDTEEDEIEDIEDIKDIEDIEDIEDFEDESDEDDEGETEESDEDEDESEDDEDSEDEEESDEDDEGETEDDDSVEDDEEDEEDDEPAPKTKKTKGSVKEKATKAVKKVIEVATTPAKKLVEAVKDKSFGPAKGRRLYDEQYADTEVVDTRSANKEENLNTLVSRLENNGLGYIFDGCKFATEKRVIAGVVLESMEQAVLDCLFVKGTGFAFLNGRIDAKAVDPKFYPVIKGGNMSTPVIKGAHSLIKLNNAEFEKSVGLVYRNENNSSEVSFPVKDNGDDTYTVLANNLFSNKGDIVDANGKPVKKTTKKAPAGKKVVKKK